jgi:hypothetical protein
MTLTHWHLRVTVESSVRQKAVDLARQARQTPANYVASLIEQAQKEDTWLPEKSFSNSDN